jgi:hypothetical protein
MHGHPFDSKHTFHVNRFADIERFGSMDEMYVEPKLEPYMPRVRFLLFGCCRGFLVLNTRRSTSGLG